MTAATAARVGRRVDRWLFPGAPPERLAVFRVLLGLYTTTYLAVRLPVFLGLADGTADQFEPVGILAALGGPLPAPLVTALAAGVLVLSVAFLLGAAFRWTGPAFAIGLLVLTTYRSSWGQIVWLELVMVLHVLIVGCSRSADAFAIGRRRSGRQEDTPLPSAAYGAPMQLAALVLVASYVLAGVAKLREGGLAWAVGDSLRNHVAATAVRADVLGGVSSPIGAWLVQFGWLFPPVAMVSLLLELGAPVALLGGRIRDAWVAGTWLMHLGIAALMFVTFPYPLSLVAFAPLYRLERLPATLAAWRRQHAARRLTPP